MIENEMLVASEEYKKTKEEQISKARSIFAKIQKEIFKDGFIDEVYWHQYIPSYNDGDACEFTVSNVYFIFSEDKNKLDSKQFATAFHNSVNESCYLSYVDKVKEHLLTDRRILKLRAHLSNIESFVGSSWAEDFIQGEFGTNVKVTMTPTGCSSEYSDYGN